MPTVAELKAAAEDARRVAAEALSNAESLTAAALKAAREEQQAKERAESAEHNDLMYNEIGQPLAGLSRAQHDIVYDQAYQQGRTYGYSEIESQYGELAEMARKLFAAK